MTTIEEITEELMRQNIMLKELQADVQALKEYKQRRDATWAEAGRRLAETETV